MLAPLEMPRHEEPGLCDAFAHAGRIDGGQLCRKSGIAFDIAAQERLPQRQSRCGFDGVHLRGNSRGRCRPAGRQKGMGLLDQQVGAEIVVGPGLGQATLEDADRIIDVTAVHAQLAAQCRRGNDGASLLQLLLDDRSGRPLHGRTDLQQQCCGEQHLRRVILDGGQGCDHQRSDPGLDQFANSWLHGGVVAKSNQHLCRFQAGVQRACTRVVTRVVPTPRLCAMQGRGRATR